MITLTIPDSLSFQLPVSETLKRASRFWITLSLCPRDRHSMTTRSTSKHYQLFVICDLAILTATILGPSNSRTLKCRILPLERSMVQIPLESMTMIPLDRRCVLLYEWCRTFHNFRNWEFTMQRLQHHLPLQTPNSEIVKFNALECS
jgi:hypothetical protein